MAILQKIVLISSFSLSCMEICLHFPQFLSDKQHKTHTNDLNQPLFGASALIILKVFSLFLLNVCNVKI